LKRLHMNWLYTTIALVFFAANSLLCRMALSEQSIDPAGFTIVRLSSGALCLWMLLAFKKSTSKPLQHGDYLSSLMLFLYAIFFSYAYTQLDTGIGALILFGSVQLTMIVAARVSGESLKAISLIGAAIAFGGLVYLLSPGISAPPITGAGLMAASGIAWGFYTLKGRGVSIPIAATAGNFIRTLIFVTVLLAVTFQQLNFSQKGVLLAIASGAVTSGLGYAIWYMALRNLSAAQASILQLLVPVIAAFSGVIFLSETVTFRLLIASVVILGGVMLAIIGPKINPRKA